MHVYLTGFMGAGKSTVGSFLARLLGRPFVDLDREIETAAGSTIVEIFASRGEKAFRKLESAVLESVDDRVPAVVALGGGTLSKSGNAKRISGRGTTVWLDVPFDVLLDRLGQQEQDRRPLYESETAVKKLYDKRLPGYRKAEIHMEISATDSAEAVAAAIRNVLEGRECAI